MGDRSSFQSRSLTSRRSAGIHAAPSQLNPRPFAPNTSIPSLQRSSAEVRQLIQAKLDHAQKFGHDLTRTIYQPSPFSPVANTNVSPIQPKLTIGAPGDKYEQEADRVAAAVIEQINQPQPQSSASVQREESRLQREEMPEEEELQTKALRPELQREELPDDDELQTKALVQQQADGASETADDLETTIDSARGSGQALDERLQQSMGQAMGADFSGVRVHTDGRSHQLNQSIQARAFTTGQDVFFRQGEYQPGSRGGQELIAHELTHVVQQNGGVIQKQSLSSPPPYLADDQMMPLTPGEKGRVQRLSMEYYTAAQINLGSRATAHMTEQTLRNYLALYHKEIVVGKGNTIKVGEGRKTGYATNGCIKYDCDYNEGQESHIVHVWHAHDQGKMG